MSCKLLSLVCASSLPFLFTLNGDFVFDDSEAIVKNKDVSSNAWANSFYNDFWGANIKSNYSHKSYRPLTILSFRLNYIMNGEAFSAVQFKITNLVCHVACCFAVWQTFESILRAPGIKNLSKTNETDLAYLAALLFAVHPVHVEAVSGIVGRADLLAALTFFLAFLSYTRAINRPIYLIVTVILAAISMLFKENGVTVLGFCIAYEIITMFVTKYKIKTKMKKYSICNYFNIGSIIRIIFLTMAVILILYGRWTIMGGVPPEFYPVDNPAAFSDHLFTRIATYNYIYVLNLLLLVWPRWLCYDWSMGCIPLVENILDYRILSVVLMYLYAILVIVALLHRRNNASTKRVILLALSLAVMPFLPASNIFYSVGFVIAERILYISSAGYCLLVTVGFNKLIQNDKRYKQSMALFSLVILTYGLKSWHRSYAWQNEFQLFASGLAVCPLNAKVHYNVAKVADAMEHTEWALQEYKQAISLYPKYYQAMNNLANLLKKHKNYAAAELHLRAAIRLKQDFPVAWMNLGIVLASVNRHAESLNAYKSALEYRRNYPDCLYNLGNLYLEVNKTEEAIESWLQAIDINPKHVLAWTNLLALLDNTDRLEEALRLIPKALEELPESPVVNFAIANIHGKLEHYKEAEKHFIKAIDLFDNKVQAVHYANFGVLYHRAKQYEAAKKMYKYALKIDPQFKSAQKYLKSLSIDPKNENK